MRLVVNPRWCQGLDLLRICKRAALAAIKGALFLTSNDANCHEHNTTNYDSVVNPLLMRYTTVAIIEKAYETV